MHHLLSKRSTKISFISLSLFACLLTFLLFPKFAFAGSVSKSASSFDSAWELYASSADGKANMTYGFNTYAIHEDYVHGIHSTLSHYSALNNGSGWHTGTGKDAGKYSNVDVTHSGSYVSYYLFY